MLCINETHVNETEGYRMGDSEWYETFTDNLGKLFRSLQKQYGRAQKMYRDNPDRQVGWVFHRKEKYEDADKYYEHCVWIEVSTTMPEKIYRLENLNHPFK